MIIYLVRYGNPADGGYYAAQDHKPIVAPWGREERWADEVRVVDEFPEDVWEFAIQGGLPVDPEGEGHDLVWEPWWREATTIWKRE